MFLQNGDWLKELKLHEQVIRVTYQFLLIVVLGSGVSLIYKEFIRVIEKISQERAEFLDLYSELVRLHNETKAVKRLMRAKAWRKKDGVNILLVEPYTELMDRLNIVQLDTEAIKRHVKSQNDFFASVNEYYKDEKDKQDKKNKKNKKNKKPDSIYKDLENIEKYLNKIIKEYETALRGYSKPPSYLELDKLARLEIFISPGGVKHKDKILTKDCFDSAIEKLSRVADELDI